MTKALQAEALQYAIRRERGALDGRIARIEKQAFTAGIEAIRGLLANRLDRMLWKSERSNSDYDKARLDGALWLYQVLEEED
jgi:hypothetical protein